MRTLLLTFGEYGAEWQVSGGEVPPLPISAWPIETFRDLEPFERWAVLADGCARGLIKENSPGRYSVQYADYYQIEPAMREPLGLPKEEKVSIRLESRGDWAHPGFSIEVGVHDSAGRSLAGHGRCLGPVYLRGPSDAVGLPEAVSALLTAAQNVPKQDATQTDRLLYLSRVKELAELARPFVPRLEIGTYIANECGVVADGVNIEVEGEGPSSITLSPVMRDQRGNEVKIPPGILEGTKPDKPSVWTEKQGSARKRIVLPPKQRRDAGKVPKHIRDSDVPQFVLNPEAFLPESIDLKYYSKRVKAIAPPVYNSRPYVHLRKHKGGWLEGSVEIGTDDPTADPEDSGPAAQPSENPKLSVETYGQLKKQATKEGWVLHNDKWINIDPKGGAVLDKLAGAGHDVENPEFQRIDKVLGVLKIYENVDLLEYIVADESIVRELAPGQRAEALSDTFKAKLYPYQADGYRWLHDLSRYNRGGLLADEMGLGKTVQVLAHVARCLESGGEKPVLIVLPVTLIENWSREIRKFIQPEPIVHKHTGPRSSRLRGLHSHPQIVLVSYEALRQDQLQLAREDWSVVICDEAQYVKNPTALRTSAVKALKADQRIALTGTPVENGLSELWCIMDYVQPGKLGSQKEFRSEFERPMRDEPNDAGRKALVKKLQDRCGVHYLRRLKREVLPELPPVNPPKRPEVRLSPEQVKRYGQIVRDTRNEGRGATLGAIPKLLQVCACPPDLEASVDVQLETCPKLAETLDILKAIRERGEKVLIFTRFLKVQAMLQRVIAEQLGLFPDCINGAVENSSRQRVLDLFSRGAGFNVLILSHDVGGVGLNITAANHIIHYTRPWNPAKERQATDRVHRIGQTSPVHVYLPIVGFEFKTVEARLDELLSEKASLMEDVLVRKADWNITAENLVDCIENVDVPDWEVPQVVRGRKSKKDEDPDD
jgi:superfamily II DNA or RNA helicase